MKEYKYKISVVIPVYNVENYIDETLQSVINQTIGFEDSIQMILINDGSTDNSEEICLEYQKRYPKNIIYKAKENEGVSSARNYGMQFIQGKYVNFLDSDDVWDLDVYEKAYNMLEENEEIDVVAVRLKYFEASTRYHWLDYKFTGDRIIDINIEPQNIVLHMSPSIIRTEALQGLNYDKRLEISEDTKLLTQIILKKEKYGIISTSKYNYRKRKEGGSTIQTSRENRSWYVDTFKYYQDFLIDFSIKKYGTVIPYVQYCIMYDVQWRMKTKISENITQAERKQYVDKIKEYIRLTDDDIILFQKNINEYYKLLALKIKYGDKLEEYLEIKEDGALYIKDNLLMKRKNILNIVELSNIRHGNLIIEGNILLNNNHFSLYYKINGKNRTKIDTYDRKSNINNIFEEYDYVFQSGYKIEIPLKDVKTIEFELEINGKYYVVKNSFTHFSRINNFKVGYYYDEKYLITKDKTKEKIIIQYNPGKLKVIGKELYFLGYLLLKRKKIKVAIQRILYWITKPFASKNIWLFADREFMARDSAELLFRYTNNQPNNDKRKTYFIVNKDSKDYKRMKQYGRVVGYHTMKYKLLFLHANYIISSHADAYVNNEFGKSRKFYVDLYGFKYIYLTHGVLLHDSSSWLNRVNKNIELNVVTSPMEYESILEGNYYFEPHQLMKTGLPRHDNLYNSHVEEENKILIMASWRSKLAGPIIKGTQRRMYNPKFAESEYCNFYNDLFKDERLISVLKQYNYKIKFCIHPSFRAQLQDFKGNDYVEVTIDVDSQYETVSSKVLITDYSSAACDFAYLRKPVIYANFDYDHIYDIHYYQKGYFDYDRDGFGPNCKSYDEVIEELIKMIKNNCVMEEKYKERCNKFFYYHDNNNSKRVYEEIIKNENSLK